MTAATDRLDAIDARANAASDRDALALHMVTVLGKAWQDDYSVLSVAQAIADDVLTLPSRQDVPALTAALRAVLDLHRPYQPDAVLRALGQWDASDEWCNGCEMSWPCPTVRAVESALGGAA